MLPEQTADADTFYGNLDSFFKAIGEVGGRRAIALGEPYQPLRTLLDEVVQVLRDPLNADGIKAAIRSAVSANGDLMLRHLQREINFFLALAESEMRDERSLGAAKTIKESVEKFLGPPPRWLKSLLEILNELLSLLKGG